MWLDESVAECALEQLQLSKERIKFLTVPLYSSPSLSVIQQTLEESSENFCRWHTRGEAEVRCRGWTKTWQYCSLGYASVACHHVWQAALQSDILRPVSKVVCNPGHKVLIACFTERFSARQRWKHRRSRRTWYSEYFVASPGVWKHYESR